MENKYCPQEPSSSPSSSREEQSMRRKVEKVETKKVNYFKRRDLYE